MDLRESLLAWDGKSSSNIEGIFQQFSNSAEFLESLLVLLADSETDRGATWCLKRYLDQGGTLDASQTVLALQALSDVTHWQPQLHLLQSLDKLSIPKTLKKTVEKTLRAGLIHSNKFVKAWSYNGMAVLARQHPELREEASKVLDMGLRDEPASVKARIRNAMKIGF